MTDDEWEPLPPEALKKAKKQLKHDKILLDRGFKKGQFTREYCKDRINELEIKYGLIPPEFTAEEIAEMDAELDAVLEERVKVLEKSDWEDLTEEERADAEVKLLNEKKALNRTFKLGKITREKCLERAEQLEVELGLIKPPEDFEGFVTDADIDEVAEEGSEVQPVEWQPLDPEEQEIAENLLAMDKKLLDEAYENGELTRELCITKVHELKVRYKLIPPDAPVEVDPEYAEPPEEAAEEQPDEEPIEEAAPEPDEEPVEEAAPEPVEQPTEIDAKDEWDAGAVGGDVVPTADEEVFERLTRSSDEEPEPDEDLAESLEDVDPSYQEPEVGEEVEVSETVEEMELEARETVEEMELEAPEVVDEAEEYESEPVEEVSEPVEEPVDQEVAPVDQEVETVEEVFEPIGEYESETVEDVPEPAEEEYAEATEPEYVEETEEYVEEGAMSEEELKEEQLANLTTIPGVGMKKAEILYDAGFRTIHEVHEAGVKELTQVMGPKTAVSIVVALKSMVQEEAQPPPEPVPEEVPEPEPDPRTDKEIEDQASMEEVEEIQKEIKISKILLIVGIVLCTIGVSGVFGFRLGWIQNLLGDPTPYPGVGFVEPQGHIVSIIPFVIGLAAIVYWGFKNDPLYYEKERLEEEVDELDEEEAYLEPSEVVAPSEEIQEEIEAMGQAIEDEQAKLELEQAENARVERCEKMLNAAFILFEDRDRLADLIPTGISAKDFTDEVRAAVEKRKEHDFTAEEKAEVLTDDLVGELAALDDIIDSDEREDEDDDVDVDDIIKEIEDLEDF